MARRKFLRVNTWCVRYLLTLLLFSAGTVCAQSDDGFKTLRQWQFGVGPAYTSGLNTPYVITGWRLGYGVQFQPRFDLQVVADWAFSSKNTDMHFFVAELASNYYFTDEVTTPFATVDLGYGSAHSHRPCNSVVCEMPSDDASGLAMGAGLGIKTLNGSGFNLAVLAHYQLLFSTTTYGTPAECTIQGVFYY